MYCFAPSIGFRVLSIGFGVVLLIGKVEFSLPKGDLTLLIDKSDRTLSLLRDGKTLTTYKVVLGTNPVDDKLREGDRCTPEGTFRVKAKYAHKSWSKFIWIDYPTGDSYRKHRSAKMSGRIPHDAGIGGEIGIHGCPEGQDGRIDEGVNWTFGCIALKRADVDALYRVVRLGMRVDIRP